MSLRTDIPARLDRLPWARFHTMIVLALGITWLLDGLEVTLVGALSNALLASPRLQFSAEDVAASASAYLAGAVLGALFFGTLADRLGRKKLFFVTLAVYALATGATAFSTGFDSFAVFRFLTGAGIGGEYAAINSAIQELVPARFRGRTDLAINGTFWLGAVLGSIMSAILLVPGRFPPDIGWRLAFLLGALLALLVLLLRRSVPESPRWLLTHGQHAKAEQIVTEVERHVLHRKARIPRGAPTEAAAHLDAGIAIHPDRRAGLLDLALSLFHLYPRRSALGLVLMTAQAFFYNAIFFTFALVLTSFYAVRTESVGLYLLPFAITNFAGPLALGWLFDRWGRRQMISSTYAISGVLLTAIALHFGAGGFDAQSLTMAFALVFFFASAAASAAYLTVSEAFPLEVRASAIAVFYAFGTALGGVAAPWLFGKLIGTGDAIHVAWGYGFAAALMLVAAIVELWLGFAAERRSLEELATPLSAISQER